MARITTLAKIPLFSLTHAQPDPDTDIRSCFVYWPNDHLNILSSAQKMRNAIAKEIGDQQIPQMRKIEIVDKYLPYAIAMEKIKNDSTKVKASKENKFKWRQSPVVVSKYIDRSFSADYVANEVLHTIWLKGILLLNFATILSKEDDLEKAITTLKECAGVFQYLASDRLRMSNETVAIEFQAPVFNSFTSLALAEAYALIAYKGEQDGISQSALGKLAYTVSATFSSALDAINSAKPNTKFIHQQYINFITGAKLFFQAVSAVNLAFHVKGQSQIGKAIGLIRLAINYLDKAIKLDKHNLRLNEAIKELAPQLPQYDKKWTDENALIQAEYIPPFAEAEMFMTTTCTMMPNLPQPIQFVLPEPEI